jgi:two-component system, OmpR family, response regulator RegX3
VRAVLRRVRSEAGESAPTGVLRAGRLLLDLDRHELTVDGRQVELSSKVFHLLRLLMLNRGHVLSREVLIDRVWGDDFMG